jgi:hypothetical protein
MILEMIQTVEQAIGKGNGAVKASLVSNAVSQAAIASGANPAQVSAIQSLATSMIDSNVASLNSVSLLSGSTLVKK